MRQLFLDQGNIVIKQVEQPLLEPTMMLVAVHYSFVSSGTEAATISSSAPTSLLTNISGKIEKVVKVIKERGILEIKNLVLDSVKGGLIQQLGYSCAGRVIAVGSKITELRPGDFVACAGAGLANHADIIAVPQNLAAKVTKPEVLQHASITTIGAIALQGIRRAQLQLGETVCIIGLGLLGQLSLQLARLAGCRVIGIDLIPERLAIAKQQGAFAVFDARDESLQATIDFLTAHHGVDCTLLTAASQSDALIQQAMQLTRRKGKVVIVGDVGLGVQRDPFYKKEIDLLISCSYGPGRYDVSYEQQGIDYPYAYVRWTENRNMHTIVQMIEEGSLQIAPLISQCFDISNAIEGYKRIQDKESLGILISYLPNSEQIGMQPVDSTIKKSPLPLETFFPAKKTTIRLGVIGAGGFARTKLLPIIRSLKNVTIQAVVDANPESSLSVARLYNATNTFADDAHLFDSDLVDAVLIASPHSYHADQIMRALSHGKAVFAEKPLLTTWDQLTNFKEFLSQNKNVPLCVDYNRSFAPFMFKIRECIANRSTPLMIHYRMNAGFIPKTHWVQTEVGAGRLIGEACHIFDLFCVLTNSTPVAVSVESLKPNKESIGVTDNASIQVSFSDGSVCSLLYTALGNTQAGKERMELYYDGKTIIMDDYCLLQGYGLPSSFKQKESFPDKGHEYLLRQFFGALREEKPVMPMSIDHLLRVSHLTLAIDQLAQEGGGSLEKLG